MLVPALLLALAPAPCDSFAGSPALADLTRALDRAAAVQPVWDDYSLAPHPVVLVGAPADTSADGAVRGCALLWRAGRPARVLPLAAPLPFRNPLYAFWNTDSVGPAAAPVWRRFAEPLRATAPEIAEALTDSGFSRAILMPVPIPYRRLGPVGDAIEKSGRPDIIQTMLAVHENYHLHSQFPRFLDQPGRHAWPAWDRQPDRPAVSARCYRGTPEVRAAHQGEMARLLAAWDHLWTATVPDTAAARQAARDYVALRQARYRMLDGVTITAQDSSRISCGVAEDIMELEEGVANWVAGATVVRAGVAPVGHLRTSFTADQVDAFYQSGAMMLGVLDGLLGPEAVRRLGAAIARSTGPESALFARFGRDLGAPAAPPAVPPGNR